MIPFFVAFFQHFNDILVGKKAPSRLLSVSLSALHSSQHRMPTVGFLSVGFPAIRTAGALLYWGVGSLSIRAFNVHGDMEQEEKLVPRKWNRAYENKHKVDLMLWDQHSLFHKIQERIYSFLKKISRNWE